MTPWWVNYIGIPYQADRCGREGCNCWGLVRLVWKEQLHFDVPDFLRVRTSADLARLTQAAQWQEVQEPEPFAIALYQFPDGLLHSGIVVDAQTLLHTGQRSDSKLDPSRKYRPYLQGFYWPKDHLNRSADGSDYRPS